MAVASAGSATGQARPRQARPAGGGGVIVGVMCAYQEAGLLGPALESLRAAGCERLVVVDGAWRWFDRYGDGPGSTDGTQELARSLGAEVIEAPAAGWPDQVTARNAYFVGEPGDWYVILDADERMTGVLPGTLDDAPEGAYQVWVRTAGESPVRRIRLVREDGSLRYQYAHWAMYREGRVIDQAALLDDVVIEHADRPGDADRTRRKRDWYARASGQERAFLKGGWAPRLAVEVGEMDKIALRYVGGGAWMPGVPARDLTEAEAAMYAEEVAENMAGARPLWVAEDHGELGQRMAEGGEDGPEPAARAVSEDAVREAPPSSISSQGEEGQSRRGRGARRGAKAAAEPLDDDNEESD